jgi:hypothetical protein
MLAKPDKLVRYDPGEYRQRFTFFFWVILVAVCILVLRLWYHPRFPGCRSRGEPAVL